MEVIKLKNVSRKFIKRESQHKNRSIRVKEEFWALKDINFKVRDGEIVGIVGRNGAGKTTLLEIISGIIPPTRGSISKTGEVSSLLTLGAGFEDELSGRENIYLNSTLLGLKKSEIRNKFDSIVKFSELGDFINEPLGGYSDGMRMRLGFSVAIHIDFEILAIDEVIMVGDISFQKKCFKKLVEFKEQGKTMIISTQSMDVINKLCNRVILMEEGKVVFDGTTSEGINRYLRLLNQKKFLERQKRSNLIRNTKKWATDMDYWGEKKGNKEVEITKVKTLNRWHIPAFSFRTGGKAIIEVYFEAYKKIKDYHFGIALFREDGVYCYGPNTKNDGYELTYMGKGKGFFKLEYKSLLLNPGIYYFAIVIWDRDETFAYDYHRCCNKIEITGERCDGQLLNFNPYSFPRRILNFFRIDNSDENIKINKLKERWGEKLRATDVCIDEIKLLDDKGMTKESFLTNEYLEIRTIFSINNKDIIDKMILWVGLFREDSIYCYGKTKNIGINDKTFSLINKNLKLLPGNYRVSVGFWDVDKNTFICFNHGNISFNVSFIKRDHGTVYLDHKWKLKIPK